MVSDFSHIFPLGKVLISTYLILLLPDFIQNVQFDIHFHTIDFHNLFKLESSLPCCHCFLQSASIIVIFEALPKVLNKIIDEFIVLVIFLCYHLLRRMW